MKTEKTLNGQATPEQIEIWKTPTRNEREWIENAYLDVIRAQIRIQLIGLTWPLLKLKPIQLSGVT